MEKKDIDFINEQGIVSLDSSTRELSVTYNESIPLEYIPQIGSMLSVDTTRDMERLNTIFSNLVYVKGRLDKNDGLGGIFVFDESRQNENDGGLVFNGWVRQFVGHIHPGWFGNNNFKYDLIFDMKEEYPYINRLKQSIEESDQVLIAQTGQSLAQGGSGGGPVLGTDPDIDRQKLEMIGEYPVEYSTRRATKTIGPYIRRPTVTTIGESMSSNLINNIKNIKIVFHGHAYGGQNYLSLKKNGTTDVYSKVMEQAATAHGYRGGKYKCVTLVHGEQDGVDNNKLYDSNLKEWQSDYQQDLQSVTGQQEEIPMYMSQVATSSGYGNNGGIMELSFPAAILQEKACREEDLLVMVCPKYFLEYADHAHITNNAQRVMGEYYAKAITAGKNFKPLSPSTIETELNTLIIGFDGRVGDIIFDTTNVKPAANMGFDYNDDDGAKITNVSILNNQVIIELDKNVGNNPKVSYAYHNGDSTGAANQVAGLGERGNLRDSDSTKSIYTNNNLYNWCITFRREL